MTRRSKKTPKSQANLQDFVIVTFTEDLEQAKDHETLLKNNDIPAVSREQSEQPTNDRRIAVMVPEDFLDEAHVVIESQDAYDDFYDFVSEEEGTSDFDEDFFEDEF